MKIDITTMLARLRAHRAEFEGMGVQHLALFGSQVRGESDDASDVDVDVVFDDAMRADAPAYFGHRQTVADRPASLLGVDVDLSDEAMQRPNVRERYEVDRVYAF